MMHGKKYMMSKIYIFIIVLSLTACAKLQYSDNAYCLLHDPVYYIKKENRKLIDKTEPGLQKYLYKLALIYKRKCGG